MPIPPLNIGLGERTITCLFSSGQEEVYSRDCTKELHLRSFLCALISFIQQNPRFQANIVLVFWGGGRECILHVAQI